MSNKGKIVLAALIFVLLQFVLLRFVVFAISVMVNSLELNGQVVTTFEPSHSVTKNAWLDGVPVSGPGF